MPHFLKPNQGLVTLFTRKPCWTIAPLAAELQYSIPAVRRFLAGAGYYSSFTHNGGWYTLRSIPRFGRDGLWFYRDIGFSRFGSLTHTLVELTTRSPAGMSAEQLGEKLHCRCHSVLVHLYRKGQVQRDKLGRSYVYFGADPDIAAGQRRALARQNPPPFQLPAEIAVLLLVDFIRSPEAGFEELAKKIAHNHQVTIDVAQIERFFDQHGLKKTIPPAVPAPYRP